MHASCRVLFMLLLLGCSFFFTLSSLCIMYSRRGMRTLAADNKALERGHGSWTPNFGTWFGCLFLTTTDKSGKTVVQNKFSSPCRTLPFASADRTTSLRISIKTENVPTGRSLAIPEYATRANSREIPYEFGLFILMEMFQKSIFIPFGPSVSF